MRNAARQNQRPFDRKEKNAVLVAAILASSLGFIDGSVVSVALPSIRADLQSSFAAVQWVAGGYALFLSALILVGGAAGDRFGQRETLIGGIAAFSIASIGCAAAFSTSSLIVCRALQGVAAAFMVPGSLALIARAFPPEERGRAIGLWSTMSAIAAAGGPLLGGLLIDLGGQGAWRFIFWINPPIGAAAVMLLVHRTRPRPVNRGARLDWPGAALATLGLGLVTYALTMANETAAWALLVVGLGLIGVLACLAFVVWEGRAETPMMPLSLFESRAFNGANLLTFCLYFALSGVMFFLPITLIEAFHLPETAAGSVFLPFTATMALLARFAGTYADRFGPRLPIVTGSVVVACSMATLALAVTHGQYALGVMPAMALLGVGMGLVVAPLSTAVMTATSDSSAGAASGVNNGVARVAGLFAVAVLGLLATHVYGSQVSADLSTAGYGAPAVSLSDADAAIRVAALKNSFFAVALATAFLAVASAIIAVLMLPAERDGEASVSQTSFSGS